MTEIRAKETQETNVHLLCGVNIWMRMRAVCDVRRTSVRNIPDTIHVRTWYQAFIRR